MFRMKTIIILVVAIAYSTSYALEEQSFDILCLTELLKSQGLSVKQFDAILQKYGYSLAQLKQDVTPGMTLVDAQAVFHRLGYDVAALQRLLATKGLTVQEVLAAVTGCRQKRSFDTFCLIDLLKSQGLSVKQFDALLQKYGYSIAQLKQDVTPGMTLADAQAVLHRLGYDVAALQRLLATKGLTTQEVLAAISGCRQKRSFDIYCLTELLKSQGLSVKQFDALLQKYGYSLAQLKQDVTPGMTLADAQAVLHHLGYDVAALQRLLAIKGLTVQEVLAAISGCRQKRSFNIFCLTELLKSQGLSVKQFDALLQKYGYSVAQLKQDVTPGMTLAEAQAVLHRLGYDVAALQRLLATKGLTVQKVLAAISGCRQKRSFDSNCLESVLNNNGLTKQELHAILSKYGYSIGQLLGDLRPGVTIEQVKAKLAILGITIEDLQAFLENLGTSLEKVFADIASCRS